MRHLRIRYGLALGIPLAMLGTAEAEECQQAEVCGSVAAPGVKGSCGPSGDSLQAYGTISGIRATWGPHDPTLAGLKLDPAATERYRATLSDLPVDNYCCYSGCAPESVVPDAGSCPTEHAKEFTCGSVGEPSKKGRCGDEVSALVFRGQSATIPTTRPGPPVRTDSPPEPPVALTLDDPLTAQYRAKLHPIARESNYCCYSACRDLKASAGASSVGLPAIGSKPIVRCIPHHDTEFPAEGAPRCAQTVVLGQAVGFAHEAEGQCCYVTGWQAPQQIKHPRGRPLRVEHEAKSAPVIRGTGWSMELMATYGGHEGPELSETWAREAQLEHASVAAFSKLALQLMGLGAPADLVDAVHAAARDEVHHARQAFALASFYGGTSLGPGPMPDALAGFDADVETIARETLVDGCIGEAVAGEEAMRASRCACDPVVAEVLEGIAHDEAGHAELSWRILGWLRERSPEVVDAVVRQVRSELLAALPDESGESCCARPLRAHGVLCAHEREDLRTAVVMEVVLPILEVAV